ncbi:hypothetical protein EZ456_04330 [Pedobacter psychrodurus]|uniref:Uncharacterized protein n=1 Tax=Pedobacter psychrodurus TaxID=2530456 RepID=A0A4R0PZD9_9SPHI|nr:hypothetical protein [Pedobacter psychrodurus]TCD28622.1 hypothetical protein EZ456_04330 [Pedobacter psychrodurus]
MTLIKINYQTQQNTRLVTQPNKINLNQLSHGSPPPVLPPHKIFKFPPEPFPFIPVPKKATTKSTQQPLAASTNNIERGYFAPSAPIMQQKLTKTVSINFPNQFITVS